MSQLCESADWSAIPGTWNEKETWSDIIKMVFYPCIQIRVFLTSFNWNICPRFRENTCIAVSLHTRFNSHGQVLYSPPIKHVNFIDISTVISCFMSASLCTNTIISKYVTFPYLIGTGDPQSVEHWDKDLSGDGRHDGVGEAEEPEGSSELVGLGRCADDCDARHEAGSERHGNRHSCHLPSTQQELGAARLFPAPDGLEEANASRSQNNSSEHHIIPHRESVHWTTCTSHG